MKSVEWKTYRTRFLVQAKKLNSALSFIDPLGRRHCGRRGDYLVESSDGVISIAPRQIFEDIYVPILPDEPHTFEAKSGQCSQNRAPFSEGGGVASSRDLHRDEPARVRRKLPQSAGARTGSPRLGLM